MYALMVIVSVLENEIETFLQKTIECTRATRSENGNLRYDILRNEDNPLCLVIYEGYRSKEDFLLHRETPHSIKWKTETKSMTEKARERFRGHAVYFSE